MLSYFLIENPKKNRTVREFRDLLVDMHRYLAWVLHTSAEEGAGNGSVPEADRKSLLIKYLTAHGHDSKLVEQLFTGMVERVVAIVSRVQGTYEFEVQPLREYFAARYLYDTSPYSPPGRERAGTKPQRFNALAKNFYWLNVTRFFCGCFSSGELASLSDGLSELARSSPFDLLSHPRTLSTMLLSDWVFTQQPLAMRRVVDELFQQPGFKIFLSVSSRPPSPSGIVLPERCGRSELVDNLYRQLKCTQRYEDRISILRLIRRNSNPEDIHRKWRASEPENEKSGDWLIDGATLGIFHNDGETISSLISVYKEKTVPALLKSNRFDIISGNDDLRAEAISLLFNDKLTGVFGGESVTKFQRLAQIISSTTIHHLLLGNRMKGIALHAVRQFFGIQEQAATAAEERYHIESIIKVVEQNLNQKLEVWRTSLEPWRASVNACITAFGVQWAFVRVAVSAAGVRADPGSAEWTRDAWSGSGDLVGATRFARLKSGNVNWWREQIREAPKATLERRALALTLCTWATIRTLTILRSEISNFLDDFAFEEWKQVCDALDDIPSVNPTRESERLDVSSLHGTSKRLALVIAKRGSVKIASSIASDIFYDLSHIDDMSLSFTADTLLQDAISGGSWAIALKAVTVAHERNLRIVVVIPDDIQMPEHIAKEICENALALPQRLVRAAQQRLSTYVGSNVSKLGQISKEEKWFQ
jgi:hypothetical protein